MKILTFYMMPLPGCRRYYYPDVAATTTRMSPLRGCYYYPDVAATWLLLLHGCRRYVAATTTTGMPPLRGYGNTA